jgi:RNA polymerase sigma-70 factor (ECF subfamily)
VKTVEGDPNEAEVDARARFESLYREHAPAVAAYVLRRASRDDALEAAAEAFVVAWRRLEDVPDPALPWLLATARRQLANISRGNQRRIALASRLTSRAEAPQAPHQPAENQQAERVRGAMSRLNTKDQELLRLVAWDGLETAETAAILGCTNGAVRVRLHRARQRLERELAVSSRTDYLSEDER